MNDLYRIRKGGGVTRSSLFLEDMNPEKVSLRAAFHVVLKKVKEVSQWKQQEVRSSKCQ